MNTSPFDKAVAHIDDYYPDIPTSVQERMLAEAELCCNEEVCMDNTYYIIDSIAKEYYKTHE